MSSVSPTRARSIRAAVAIFWRGLLDPPLADWVLCLLTPRNLVMRRTWIFGFAAAAWVMGAALPSWGQGPVLVRDIAAGPTFSPGSYASPPVRFRGEDYFAADDGFLGYELWATNGSLRGTRLVADICPGRCSGQVWRLTVSGN